MDHKLNISYSAAVYLRLSKEDEDLSSTLKNDKMESNSIVNQRALILNELKSMPDVTLYDIYIDDGFTGLDFKRPDFLRMINDIHEGKVNMVIVKDLSRLGRDYIDAGRYVQRIFPSMNVRFVSILDQFDSLTATDSDRNLLIPIKNFVNDNYSRDISGKVRSHQEVMRANGLYIGAYVAYGYRKSKDNRNEIEPDEYAASVVKKIFAWRLQGLSSAVIAKKLNTTGILAPSDYKKACGINYKTGFQTKAQIKWGVSTINRILTNRIYIGVLEQGKRTKVGYKIAKVVEQPECAWAVKEDNHEAIISKADFEEVARLSKRDTRIAPTAESLYPFAGVMYCGDCGRLMVRRISRYKEHKNIFYICTTYNRGEGCTRHSIEEQRLSDILLTTIHSHINNLNEMEQMLEKIEALEISYEDIIANDVELLKRYDDLEKCKKSKSVLKQDLLDELITLQEYEQFQSIYEEKCAQLEETIQNIRHEIGKVFEGGILANEWIKKFKSQERITEINRALVVALVDKIIIYEDKRIEISFKFMDEYRVLCRVIESAGYSVMSGGEEKYAKKA